VKIYRDVQVRMFSGQVRPGYPGEWWLIKSEPWNANTHLLMRTWIRVA